MQNYIADADAFIRLIKESENGRDNDCGDFHGHECIGNRNRQDQWPEAFEIASRVYRSKGGKNL